MIFVRVVSIKKDTVISWETGERSNITLQCDNFKEGAKEADKLTIVYSQVLGKKCNIHGATYYKLSSKCDRRRTKVVSAGCLSSARCVAVSGWLPAKMQLTVHVHLFVQTLIWLVATNKVWE